MLDSSTNPDGERIRTLRQERRLTQLELAEASGLSKRTIEKAETGFAVTSSTLRAIAKALEVNQTELVSFGAGRNEADAAKDRDSVGEETMMASCLSKLNTAVRKIDYIASADEASIPSAASLPLISGSTADPAALEMKGSGLLHHFDFNQRGLGFDMLIRLQKRLNPESARIVCFTGHTLGDLLWRLLGTKIKHISIFMGTIETARRLDSSRQGALLREWWGADTADLCRYIDEGRINIRYYDCPPTFSGIALDQSAYLINPYVWMPTLNWLRTRDPEAYREHWDKMNVHRRPNHDDFTINGVDMPSVLVSKSYDGPAGEAFEALSHTFELVWNTYEKDLGRPAKQGSLERPPKHANPIQEMIALQESLLAKSRIKAENDPQ